MGNLSIPPGQCPFGTHKNSSSTIRERQSRLGRGLGAADENLVNKGGGRGCNSNIVRAMPCSSFIPGGENGSFRNLKLNESTFLASLMPKKEIAADRFIEAHPNFDGRGVVIAIFDSGVDPAADGLQVTSDGQPKILDVLDCTGSGDIDTSTVLKADANGCIRGVSGASLVVNSSWKNPTEEWHVGYKLVYEIFTDTLTSRLKKERKKRWDEKNQEAITAAVKDLDDFDKVEETPKTYEKKEFTFWGLLS